MGTTRWVMRTELRRLWRAPTWALLMALFAVLVATGAWRGAATAGAHQQAVDAVVSASTTLREQRRQALADAVRENRPAPRAAWLPYAQVHHIGLPSLRYTALAAGPLSGVDTLARVAPIADTHALFDEYAGATAHPQALQAGVFDLAFVLVMLLPLFVLATAFDGWTSEREALRAATLTALCGSARPLLFGKLLAQGLLVVLPMALMATAALVAAAAALPAGPNAPGWTSAAPLTVFLLALTWGLLWLATAAVINTFARRAATAAVASGLAWLVVTVALPALMSAVLAWQAPAPSRAALTVSLREALVDAQRRGDEVIASFMNRHPTAAAELENLSGQARRYYAVQLAADEAVAPVMAEFRARQAARLALADTLRLVSPAVALRDGLERAAGSDLGRAWAFRDQAYAHLDALRAFVTPYLLTDRRLAPDDYARMPTFRFVEPPPAWRAQMLNVAALGLPALLLLALVYRRAAHLGTD